jgi:hypothetical protein
VLAFMPFAEELIISTNHWAIVHGRACYGNGPTGRANIREGSHCKRGEISIARQAGGRNTAYRDNVPTDRAMSRDRIHLRLLRAA